MSKISPKLLETEKDYWICDLCKTNSEMQNVQCPCPVTQCEAKKIGKVVTIKYLILTKKKKKKK